MNNTKNTTTTPSSTALQAAENLMPAHAHLRGPLAHALTRVERLERDVESLRPQAERLDRLKALLRASFETEIDQQRAINAGDVKATESLHRVLDHLRARIEQAAEWSGADDEPAASDNVWGLMGPVLMADIERDAPKGTVGVTHAELDRLHLIEAMARGAWSEVPKVEVAQAGGGKLRIHIAGIVAQALASMLIDHADELGAPNCVEYSLARSDGTEVTALVMRPEGKTPSELRLEAELARDAALARLKEAEARIERVGALVAEWGCDCDDEVECSDLPGGDTCEDLGHSPCLAHRIQRALIGGAS